MWEVRGDPLGFLTAPPKSLSFIVLNKNEPKKLKKIEIPGANAPKTKMAATKQLKISFCHLLRKL